MGITQTGFVRLGATAEQLSEFPFSFQQGMAVENRSKVLGDTGDDKPGLWWWGNAEKPVDATLLIYHLDTEELEKLVAKHRRLVDQSGGHVVHEVSLAELPENGPTREPFGFVDGISQPIIRGTKSWNTKSDAIHVVEPGEILLGYPDLSLIHI